jgi:hypothetical protein
MIEMDERVTHMPLTVHYAVVIVAVLTLAVTSMS